MLGDADADAEGLILAEGLALSDLLDDAEGEALPDALGEIEIDGLALGDAD